MSGLKNKFIENFKKNKYIWLTFIIASLIFLIVFFIKKIIPVGNNTMLTVDFYHQYGPLLSELYDKIKAGDGLIYSFNTGLGLPFFRNFYNYLSSPLNIIMLLFSRDNVVTSFSIIIALKIIIAATIMSYFLKKAFNKNSLLITIFGLSYAFSSYFVAFYWNIMWLDSLIFLPLVILGIKKLVDENKINLYIISLFLSIISNYFISFMICIFSCIFFIVYIIFKSNITRKDLIKKLLLFGISSFLAGGLAAFMLLPYISSLSSISATGDKFIFYKTFNFNLIDFFANHFSLVKTVVFSSQEHFLPNVSSGIIIFTLTLAFYFNSDIKIKHKIMASIFIAILIFSFIYVPLDFIWHGFHTPNDLPFRYSFIYVFIINTMAFYSISKINHLKLRYSFIIFSIILGFLIYLNLSNFLNSFCYEFNMLILLIIFILYLSNKLKKNKFTLFIMLAVVCIDIILNINENWDINHDKTIFMENYNNVEPVIQYIKENDDSLYRIEKDFNQTLNDGAWYNYNGLSIFSSVAYENMAKTQKKLGIAGNDVNSYYYKQNTPIYNSIMGIKYLINVDTNNSANTLTDNINGYNIYKNNYYLPFAFAVKNDITEWLNFSINPFANQQDFVYKSTNIDQIFEKLTIEYDTEQTDYNFYNDILFNNNHDYTNEAVLTIKPNMDGNVYLYVESYELNSFYVNERFYPITTNEPYIVDIGYFETDNEINLNFSLAENVYNVNVLAYQMDFEKFKEFYNILNENSLNITNYKSDYIEGNISTNEDKIMFTSMSYDEGFEVYINNEKVETFRIANTFLGFNIKEGNHKIKIIYKIPHLKIGLIISSISLIILILMNFLKFNKKKKSLNNKEK